MGLRSVRIGTFAIFLLGLFEFSRRVSEKLGNEEVPGLIAAIGVLAVLFSVRAVVSESAMGPEANRQKDVLWGLSIGCWVTIVIRLLGPLVA